MAISVDVIKAAKGITVTVELRRLREFHVRIWLAIKLIHLATWLMGAGKFECIRIDEGGK